MCRTTQAPFDVKPINRQHVETLKRQKRANGISNFNESLVFSLKHETLPELGRFILRFQANPDLILDEEQFEIVDGNHCFTANEETVEEYQNVENVENAARFQVLRCKVMRKPRMEDAADVATMLRVRVALCVRHGYAYPTMHDKL